MNVYVFGNNDLNKDNSAIKAANKLKNAISGLRFIYVKPNEDLPFADEKHAVLLDTVQGIDKVTVITENDLDKLIVNRSSTAHDYDLGFQLKYLRKLGKLNKITIIGIPQSGKFNYKQICLIIKNLLRYS
jgi:hypothetical protein